jgi:hypothetical protein
MRNSILLIVLLVAATGLHAQTYKWKDASGRIQYSDSPPPPGAKEVQRLSTGAGAAPAPATKQKPLADQDADFRKRLAERQEAEAKQAKAQEEEQVRSRNCEQARGQAASLETGGRMVRLNEKGERITLDDAERDRALADARKQIEQWCK